MLGAILTQNTAWANVERALARLATAGPLTAAGLLALAPAELAELIRPAGYFNVKARRLQAFCAALEAAGGLDALATMETPVLRSWLLAIHGIGPETADDILLYAYERPVFVIDAYTRRLFERLGLLAPGTGYELIRARFERALGSDLPLLNEYHALIVRHGKEVCRARRPRCADCCLAADCAYAGNDIALQRPGHAQ
ncbi:MAG: endonuclease [Chromatiaceae bacterium]|nr:MAG: endonuclease [Chromatiaceae bacterium]